MVSRFREKIMVYWVNRFRHNSRIKRSQSPFTLKCHPEHVNPELIRERGACHFYQSERRIRSPLYNTVRRSSKQPTPIISITRSIKLTFLLITSEMIEIQQFLKSTRMGSNIYERKGLETKCTSVQR